MSACFCALTMPTTGLNAIREQRAGLEDFMERRQRRIQAAGRKKLQQYKEIQAAGRKELQQIREKLERSQKAEQERR